MPLSNIREDTDNEQKHFQCVQCYKLFSTNEALSAHKKIHAEIDQCKTTLRKCLPEVIDIDDQLFVMGSLVMAMNEQQSRYLL